MEHYLQEVTDTIQRTPGTTPAHRAAFKAGYSFSALPFAAQLPIWDHVWKHSGFWQKVHAFFFLEKYMRRKDLLPVIWQTSVSWQKDVDGWGLCDCLAKLNTQALAVLPDKVYPQLVRWNKSKSLWDRRQSVVSLLYFSRTKKVHPPFDDIAALVAPLLLDKEYYVQKGVGWALREIHTVYPKEALPFLAGHIRDISAIAFTIAIEKMTEAEKDIHKRMRKKR